MEATTDIQKLLQLKVVTVVSPGGGHWELLVFDGALGTAEYMDSLHLPPGGEVEVILKWMESVCERTWTLKADKVI